MALDASTASALSMGILLLYASPLREGFEYLLMFFQTNVLVDAEGRARIAGLGMAVIPSAVPTGSEDRSFHGALAPELIEPWQWGLPDVGPTVASDIFAFALVAYEVRIKDVSFYG